MPDRVKIKRARNTKNVVDVFWNADPRITASWLSGKLVGGVDVAVKPSFNLIGTSVWGVNE